MRQASPDTIPVSLALDWSGARRVLLVRLRSIGDTVLMTPCLAALKSWRPDIEITVLSEPLAAPLLEDHPHVDHLIVARPGIAARARAVRRLRRERFDFAFNMHGGTTATFLARLSGARFTVGYKGYRYSRLLSARAPAPDLLLGRARVHSVEQQLALLNWAGVPWPASGPQLSLKVTDQALASCRARLADLGLAERRFACIAPSAALESKRWPPAGFAAVIDHLSRRYNMPSVVIAAPGQEHIAREVNERTQSKPHTIAALSLKELTAIIGMSSIFAGNDSGPAHIAAALARPLAVIFGSSDSSVWRPWTQAFYRVIESDGLRITRISEEEVIAAVDEVVQSTIAVNRSEI